MASSIEICNLALGNIRAGSINSFDEPSAQAQQCKLRYPVTRDFLLAESPWNFTHNIEPLALLENASFDVFNWVYTYQYPSDCLHINRLILNFESVTSTTGALRTRHIEDIYTPDLQSRIPHQIMTVNNKRVIVCNEPDLRISYRARVEDPNLWSASFIKVFEYYLAAELAIPIVGGELGRALREENLSLYSRYLNSAIALSMNEDFSAPTESEFITVRR